MGCNCGKRAVEAFLASGYVRDDGYLVKGEDRVKEIDVINHHTRETLTRPEVTAAAIKEAARKARERTAGLLGQLG